jgi:hypothetical protein
MFAGTFQDKVVARLPETDRERAIASGVKRFEPMPGRPMKEYLVIPSSDVTTPAALASWIERAHRHAASLPPKAATPRKTALKKTTAKTR